MEILLQIVLILVNAFFAGTEMAVVSLNATKLRKLQEEGDKTAGKLLKMVEDSSAFLSTIRLPSPWPATWAPPLPARTLPPFCRTGCTMTWGSKRSPWGH